MNGRDETTADKDPLAVTFDAAIDRNDFDDMAKVAAAYRERAAYAEGRCDGMDDAMGHLRQLASVIDPRRPNAETLRLGMMIARVMDATEAEADGQAEPAEAPAPGAPA